MTCSRRRIRNGDVIIGTEPLLEARGTVPRQIGANPKIFSVTTWCADTTRLGTSLLQGCSL